MCDVVEGIGLVRPQGAWESDEERASGGCSCHGGVHVQQEAVRHDCVVERQRPTTDGPRVGHGGSGWSVLDLRAKRDRVQGDRVASEYQPVPSKRSTSGQKLGRLTIFTADDLGVPTRRSPRWIAVEYDRDRGGAQSAESVARSPRL